MGGRVVDRNARVLGQRHDDERDQREPQRDAQAAVASSMNSATTESWVEPARSASVKTIMIIAGSASEANIISRLEPMPPKLVPTSMPTSARKKRAEPNSAVMAIRSAVQLNCSPVAKVGTSAAATHVAAKIM